MKCSMCRALCLVHSLLRLSLTALTDCYYYLPFVEEEAETKLVR